MSYTIELNNKRDDASLVSGKVNAKSAVVEIFSAMVQGKELSSFGAKADKAAKYIQELNSKAMAGDPVSVAELNNIRRLALQPVVLQEAKLLGIFGNYTRLGYNESCEVEVTEFANLGAKEQAAGQDVKFPVVRKVRKPIATTTISAGYAVDYRKASLGDMTDENELQMQVRTQLRNKAAAYVVQTIYDAITNATGIKYAFDAAGLTKTGLDGVVGNVRRFGKPTISGDYALVSQINAFMGYNGTIPVVTGISDAIMDEIHSTGLIGMYNGSVVRELPNPYDLTTVNAAGTNFETMMPQGLGFVIPTGGQSPISTVTRGDITSCTGLDVTTGQNISRFDLEVGALVAPGREYQIGMIHDSNLDSLA